MPLSSLSRRLRLFFPLVLSAGVFAQQAQQPATAPVVQPAATPGTGRIVLDVVVTPKSGTPVAGLGQKDFTLLDNKAPRELRSFQALNGREAPLEVVLLVDAVNMNYENVAYARSQIERFLKANGGQLTHPMALAVSTDTGTQIQEGFTTDGNALSASLEKYTVALRSIRRSTGFYGAEERLQLSLTTLQQLAAREGTRPGRKVVLWVSPGWPLLSGPNTDLDAKQQNAIFADVVRVSNQLRQSRITLYSIDPLGTADAGGFRTFYYKEFLKGVARPNDVSLGNLGLEVLAVQSGGLALNSSNDVASLLEQCMADTKAYYEISFDPAPAERANEFHSLEVKVGQPGLTARTRQGYYAQP